MTDNKHMITSYLLVIQIFDLYIVFLYWVENLATLKTVGKTRTPTEI